MCETTAQTILWIILAAWAIGAVAFVRKKMK